MLRKKKDKSSFDKQNIDEAKEAKHYLTEGRTKLQKSRTNEGLVEAVECFTIAIEKSATCQNINLNSIYNLRGQAFLRLGNYERADKDFNEAIHLSDEKSKIPYLNALGRCKIEVSSGEVLLIEEAYRLFEKAIDISNRTDGPSFYNLANASRLLGKIPAAIKEYGNAIKYLKASQQFDAFVNRGLCYREIGQIQNSIEDFLKACELRKDDANAQYNLGINFLETKNYEGALERFNRSIELDPKEPKFYSSKALTLFHSNQFDQALNEFSKAISLYPPSKASECWYNKGNTLLNLNRLDESLAAFETALLNMPQDRTLLAKIYYAKGLTFERLEQVEALDTFSRCLELITDKNDSLYLPTLYHLGLNQYRNKLLREAIMSFSLILENQSYDKCVYQARGKVYLELDRFEQALKDFEKVSEIEDHYPDIYFFKGLAKNNLGKTDESIEDFFHALELGSKNIGIYNGIGQTYLRAKKYEKALYYSNIALQKSPNNEEFLVQRSNIFLEINEHQKAIDDLTKALEEKPLSPIICYRRGLAFYKNKQFEDAIKDLYRAFQLKPSEMIEPDIHYHLGISFANLEQFEKAVAPLTKAIELQKKPKYYHERAKCYLLIGQNNLALADLNEVIIRQPENAYAYFRRAFAYKALKRYQETSEDFDMARKLRPRDPKLIINKKQIYEVKNKKLCEPGEEL